MRSSTVARPTWPVVALAALVSLALWLGVGGDGQARSVELPCYASVPYPGDSASRGALARWMAAAARAAGLPPELPVMASLVDSGLRNRRATGGDADSVGFFQMRTGLWNVGEYRGFATRPELQLKWFLDQAIAARIQRYARREMQFGTQPSSWGQWIADVERPAGQLVPRYQLKLEEARSLLRAP
jgi:hypothetical protein